MVVIAIIALLLSVILPALKKAKIQAQGIICLSNLHGLAQGWFAYQEENDSKLVQGNCPNPFAVGGTIPKYRYWVEPPQDEAGNYAGDVGDPDLLENEKRGIMRGLLFPYVEAVDSFHCPSDRSMKDYDGGFRSYSISGAMNGEDADELSSYFVPDGCWVTKYIEIRNPGGKVVFLENNDLYRGWNMGSWIMNYSLPAWGDPLSVWHIRRSTLGFADGHADMHHWIDESTITMSESQGWGTPVPADEGTDLEYMARAYVPGVYSR